MGDTTRLSLTNEQVKFFLETCIEEVNRVGHRGTSLHVESWAVLIKKLNEKFGKKANQKQLKNKFDYIKAKYLGWSYLRGKPGNIYNTQTNTFNLTSQEWDDFSKVHPKASSLKSNPLIYPELCAILYDKISVSGSIRRPVASRMASSSSRNSTIPTLRIEDVRIESQDDENTYDQGYSTHDQGYNTHDTGFEGGFSVSSRAMAPNVDEGRPKKRGKNTIDLSDLEVDMRKIIANFAKNKNTWPTIHECHDKLKGLGLEATDPIYLAAFVIFGQPSNNFREAWMTLPSDPDVLKSWITMMAKSLGCMK